MAALHEPLHVIIKKGMKTKERNIALCGNKTLLMTDPKDQAYTKRTGMILSIVPEKGSNTVLFSYEKRVKIAGKGPKSCKMTFDSTPNLDHFLAAYASTKNGFGSTSGNSRGDRTTISVMVNTFNCGDAIPGQEYYAFLKEATNEDQPDIVIFSGQEAPSEDISKAMTQALAPKYSQVVVRAYWGMRCYVYVHTRIQSAITNVFSGTEATGVMNCMGNKGAIGANLTVFGSPIAIICSHLAAHQHRIQDRNNDYSQIITSLDLGVSSPHNTLSSFHHIIWAGDLNYRIDQSIEEVLSAIDQDRLGDLWFDDQLQRQIEINAAFQGFDEGKIAFPPTYKFKRNTDNYDRASTRIPAWCDRVLIRSFENLAHTCMKYQSVPSVRSSDHKPVYAIWNLDMTMPAPPPPPFASAIGVKPYVEFSNLTININGEIPSCCFSFESPFLTGEASTATGRGRHSLTFPEETVPLLIPEVTIDVQYMRTLYVHIITKLADRTGIAILPLDFALVDVFRPFSEDVYDGLEKIATITGNIRIIPANEGVTQEQKVKHHKADPRHQFELRFSRQ